MSAFWKHGFADTSRGEAISVSEFAVPVRRQPKLQAMLLNIRRPSALKRPILESANNLHRQASSLLP
jgi:hypothetical protein